jgi:hypothetical protein
MVRLGHGGRFAVGFWILIIKPRENSATASLEHMTEDVAVAEAAVTV